MLREINNKTHVRLYLLFCYLIFPIKKSYFSFLLPCQGRQVTTKHNSRITINALQIPEVAVGSLRPRQFGCRCLSQKPHIRCYRQLGLIVMLLHGVFVSTLLLFFSVLPLNHNHPGYLAKIVVNSQKILIISMVYIG